MKNKFLFALFFIALLILPIFAAQTPKITKVDLTDNGIYKELITGNVHRGTLFSWGTGGINGEYYGQHIKVYFAGNETNATCQNFANLTINSTLTYENVGTVLISGARNPYTWCLNSSQGNYFGGDIGGGSSMANYDPLFHFPPIYLMPDYNCSYNNLAGNSSPLYLGYCSSYPYNVMPDGSASLNLLLWNYNTGEIYDNKTYYFIEGCETGCIGRVTVNTYGLNNYFATNVSNWTFGGTFGFLAWNGSATDALSVTKTGLANQTLNSATNYNYVNSSNFLINRIDFSLLLQTQSRSLYSAAAGGISSAQYLSGATGNLKQVSQSSATSSVSYNWQTNGSRYTPAELAANGLTYSYKLHSYMASGTGSTGATQFDYFVARQYKPSIRYSLVTYAYDFFDVCGTGIYTGMACDTAQIAASFTFSECSESQSDYTCKLQVLDATNTTIAEADAIRNYCGTLAPYLSINSPITLFGGIVGYPAETFPIGVYGVRAYCWDMDTGSEFYSNTVSINLNTIIAPATSTTITITPGSVSDYSGALAFWYQWIDRNWPLLLGLFFAACVLIIFFILSANFNLPILALIGTILACFIALVVFLITNPNGLLILIIIILLLLVIGAFAAFKGLSA